jgi:multidrug resistance efflux pump
MTDIVERLREGKTDGTHLRWMVTNIHLEAAAEVERLRGENSYLSEEVISALKAEVERLATCLATSESLKAGYIGTVEKQKAEIERLRADMRRIEALADQGIPNEATLNRIGHISGEALEHSRGTCEQGATRERAMRELAEQAQELKMGYG